VERETKGKNQMKKETLINPYNLKGKKVNSEVLVNGLIDHH